jgi:hypothetical protein
LTNIPLLDVSHLGVHPLTEGLLAYVEALEIINESSATLRRGVTVIHFTL